MSAVLKADILVTIHLAFVAFVVVAQLLIVVGWLCGWAWVRNFWFRTIHLLSIGVVAAEGLAGIECPLTGWERQLRGGDVRNLTGASPVGRFANRILFYDADHVWFQRGHITFGALVLLTFIVAPPRWPWRRAGQPQKGPADTAAAPRGEPLEGAACRAVRPAPAEPAATSRVEAPSPGATAL
jgi:hypothetical protein